MGSIKNLFFITKAIALEPDLEIFLPNQKPFAEVEKYDQDNAWANCVAIYEVE